MTEQKLEGYVDANELFAEAEVLQNEIKSKINGFLDKYHKQGRFNIDMSFELKEAIRPNHYKWGNYPYCDFKIKISNT